LSDKQRIIDLQRQVQIARRALVHISVGDSNPETIAGEALEQMTPLDQATPYPIGFGYSNPPRK
jgi:hypothetical protein